MPLIPARLRLGPVSSGCCLGRVRAESQLTGKSPTPPVGPGQTLDRPRHTPRHSSLKQVQGGEMLDERLWEWASTFDEKVAPVA